LNARNAKDESPLTVALAQGDAVLLKQLIQAGALPHVNAEGVTVVHSWLAAQHSQAQKALSDWDTTRALLSALVPSLIPPDARTHNTGETLLHYAVKYRRRHAIEALLLMGASVDCANNANVTPLQMAKKLRLPAEQIATMKDYSQKKSSCVVS
jgi:ankyrin repeat protein